jgi:hypothetical protein
MRDQALTLQLIILSLDGDDAANYNLTNGDSISGSDGSITKATVALSVNSRTYDGTTDLTGQVTITTGVGAETLTYSGATAASSHVSGPDGDTATADNYMNAITLVNATDGSGGLASNYQLPTLNVANAPVTITAATLTPTVSNSGYSQVYDGDTTADLTPTYSFSGLVSGDTRCHPHQHQQSV